MVEIFHFIVQAVVVSSGIALVIILVVLFMDWRAKRIAPSFPHPPDAASGLFEADRFYIVKLRDGEKVGPVRFEGYAITGNGEPFRSDRMSFRKPDDKRVIVDGDSIRTAEEVDPPDHPAS